MLYTVQSQITLWFILHLTRSIYRRHAIRACSPKFDKNKFLFFYFVVNIFIVYQSIPDTKTFHKRMQEKNSLLCLTLDRNCFRMTSLAEMSIACWLLCTVTGWDNISTEYMLAANNTIVTHNYKSVSLAVIEAVQVLLLLIYTNYKLLYYLSALQSWNTNHSRCQTRYTSCTSSAINWIHMRTIKSIIWT